LSKNEAKQILYDRSSRSLQSLPEAFRECLRSPVVNDRAYITERAEDIMVVVAGGDLHHVTFIPTFGASRAVTKPIRANKEKLR
jgi:hypothetical protein